MSPLRSTARTSGVAVRAMLVFTVVLGLLYTLVITGLGQLLMPWQANGSAVTDENGAVVGSALIGQAYTDADGAALPEYFQSRPSAAGDGYDGQSSGGSNLGPENPHLVAAVEQRRSEIAAREGVAVEDIPADAVTASASGLDPHISVAYALLQVPRIAEARGLSETDLRRFVESRIQGRDLGFLGEERINVVELNLALDEREAS